MRMPMLEVKELRKEFSRPEIRPGRFGVVRGLFT
jgi:hypothetical protein